MCRVRNHRAGNELWQKHELQCGYFGLKEGSQSLSSVWLQLDRVFGLLLTGHKLFGYGNPINLEVSPPHFNPLASSSWDILLMVPY